MMHYIGAMRISAMADGVVTHEAMLKNHREDYGPDVFYRTIPCCGDGQGEGLSAPSSPSSANK